MVDTEDASKFPEDGLVGYIVLSMIFKLRQAEDAAWWWRGKEPGSMTIRLGHMKGCTIYTNYWLAYAQWLQQRQRLQQRQKQPDVATD